MSEPIDDMTGSKDFERALANSMRRVNAPASLAKFLEAAAQAEQECELPRHERTHPRVFAFPNPRALSNRSWLGGAIAAVLVLACFSAEGFHLKRERERSELAEQQFETAVRVTNHALDQTRGQLERAGFSLGQ